MRKPKEVSTKYPGVRIRDKIIWLDFRYKGKRCRESTGLEATTKNIEFAYNKLGCIKFQIKTNQFNYADHFPESKKVQYFGGNPKSNMSISEAIDWWWKQNKPSDLSTQQKYQSDINNHIKPGLGKIIITTATSRQIKEWLSTINLSPSSKNNILAPLRSLFLEAYNEGIVTENIMTRILNFKREKKNKNPLTIHEVDIVINKMREKFEYELYLFFLFAIFTGLSTGEQLGLMWGDIDLKKNEIIIRRILSKNIVKDTKNGFRTRKIELLKPAYDALINLAPKNYFKNPGKHKENYIFQHPGTKTVWSSSVLSRRWKKALSQCNISHRSPYETRHTFASIMVTACLPDGWIRQQMGHSTMRMLETVYAKWLGDADEVIAWLETKTKNGPNGKQFESFFFK